MSAYQSNNGVKDSDVSKRMSNVKEKNMSHRYRHKRPDKQLYVPRALRKTDKENGVEKEDIASTISKTSVKCFQNAYLISKIKKLEIDSSLQNESPNNVQDIKISNSDIDDILNVEHDHEQSIKDINQSCGMLKIYTDINEPAESSETNSNISVDKMNVEPIDISINNVQNAEVNNETLHNSNEDVCNPINVVQVKVQDDPSSENPEDSWETMFNDDGDCLDPKFIKELCDITGQIDLAIAKSDYSNYQPASKNAAEEFQNVVELYGFPAEFSTQDLTSAFSAFQEASYNIKWVDDIHALAIFSSPAIAFQALHLSHPFIKVRPVSEGIKESKEKAKFCARMFESHKPRPVTSAVLARRLVSGALGLKVNASKEQRDIEKNILKEAKEKKRIKARQRQDIWNGIVS